MVGMARKIRIGQNTANSTKADPDVPSTPITKARIDLHALLFERGVRRNTVSLFH